MTSEHVVILKINFVLYLYYWSLLYECNFKFQSHFIKTLYITNMSIC